MLTDRYVEQAFGGGRDAVTLRSDVVHTGAVRGCLHLVAGDTRSVGPDAIAYRSWSWPDEVVVAENLDRESTLDAARARFAVCGDPGHDDFDPVERGAIMGAVSTRREVLDVGDDAFLVEVHWDMDTALFAGARLGRSIVLLSWRQSGPIDSTAPLVAALRAAVARATGEQQPDPRPGGMQEPQAALKGFLTRAALAATVDAERLEWSHDWRSDTTGLTCAQGTVDTIDRPAGRRWEGASNGDIPGHRIGLAIAHARDISGAEQGFTACREHYRQAAQPSDEGNVDIDGPPRDMDGVGDEAFAVSTDGNGTSFRLMVRSGASYMVLDATWLTMQQCVALAQAALDAFASAGRLS
ncbi:MAG: hypothetical protein M3P04_07725 [Actinomycetota bacterium]|nr:hypothetical protein [Actinomycetota bacterium]